MFKLSLEKQDDKWIAQFKDGVFSHMEFGETPEEAIDNLSNLVQNNAPA